MKMFLTILLLGACFPVFAGDTALFVRKVAIAEYRTGYLYSNGGFYSFEQGKFVRYAVGGRKVVDVCSGFNLFLALDDRGYVWTTQLGVTAVKRIETDTTGAAFDGNTAIFGYANGHTSIRKDMSLWYWGDDTFHLVHTTGRVNLRPMRLSPPGMKVKKVVMGYFRILVLTVDGEVWEWDRGRGMKPIQKLLPGKATDIFASHWDYAGCIVSGYPYIWGSSFGFWGGNAVAVDPVPLKKLWRMTAPVKVIVASYNTIHYIDSLGRLFGIGDNVMGEVGNGEELVNQHQYGAKYSWTFTKDEKLTGAPPIEVGKGIRWKALFADNFLAFYTYALDEQNHLYFWGRDKALASGRGYLNMQEVSYPNALDVLVPTKVEPMKAVFQPYRFELPSLRVGPDQTISGTGAEIGGTAVPAKLVRTTATAANGIDTLSYDIEVYDWTMVRGAAGVRIVSPHAARTRVEGLKPGIYVFNLKTTDSNAGTQSGNVTITVR